MKPKVSIVVAAYNVEKYIERSLESLANQTLKEIEVLVINDGSKDNTEEIVRRFGKRDKRFKIITQENGGLSAARNTGIRNAVGDYVAFLDGDDFVQPHMYEELYEKIKEENSDLVLCGFYKIWEDVEFVEIQRKSFQVNRNLLKGDVVANFLSKHDEPFVVAWNKLYKLQIIKENNIYFENRAFFEDVGFVTRYLYFSKNISVVDKELHYYVQRPGSITKSYNPIIEESLKNTYSLLKNFFERENKYQEEVELVKKRMEIYYYNYSLEAKKELDWKPQISLRDMKLPIKHLVALLAMNINVSFYKRLKGHYSNI